MFRLQSLRSYSSEMGATESLKFPDRSFSHFSLPTTHRLASPACRARLSSMSFSAIDQIAGTGSWLGGNLLSSAGRDIFFQPPQEPEKLHTVRDFAYPEVCAGLQFLYRPLHTKPRMLHEIGRQEPSDCLNDPMVFGGITVADSKLDHLY